MKTGQESKFNVYFSWLSQYRYSISLLNNRGGLKFHIDDVFGDRIMGGRGLTLKL